MKDILRYFINYCKDSSGQFSVQAMDRLLDKGFVITNSNNVFKKPSKNFYVLSNVETFQKFIDAVTPGTFSERQTDNGFENGIFKLQALLKNNYEIFQQGGLAELIDGESIFINYPLLFTFYNDVFRLLQKGVVINYDNQNNNITISSTETYLKYLEAARPAIPSGLKYSILDAVIPA
jgi:hypothetical protein